VARSTSNFFVPPNRISVPGFASARLSSAHFSRLSRTHFSRQH